LLHEKRHHHPASRIAVIGSRAGVNQDPSPDGSPENGTIALTHVEKM
jgi:hypothetical protein